MLAIFVPVALLLFLMVMERVEARLLPAASTAPEAGPGRPAVPGSDVTTRLPIPAQPQPRAGSAVTVPATAR